MSETAVKKEKKKWSTGKKVAVILCSVLLGADPDCGQRRVDLSAQLLPGEGLHRHRYGQS